MATSSFVDLNDGARMPAVGFGVWRIPAAQTTAAVLDALEAGYRLIDTAPGYQNEEAVGAAIARSGLRRNEIFLVSKVPNRSHGRGPTREAYERSCEALGVAAVDLYLIHWPAPHRGRYVETWETLCALRDERRMRSVGLSNFQPHHLSDVVERTGVVPAVNQVELHPYFSQPALRKLHAEQGIVTQAWSPLGQGGELLTDPAIAAIADRHGKSPAQIVLRWHCEIGTVPLPKSGNRSRIRANLELDFELDAEAVRELDALDRGRRIGPDPETFEP